MTQDPPISNQLPSTLGWRESFLFPLQNKVARREILTGGLLFLLVLPFGWILNLGNRLNVVRRLYRGETPLFTNFEPLVETFCRGCVSAGTIFSYLFPGSLLIGGSLVGLTCQDHFGYWLLLAVGILVFSLAMFCLPGCMVVYACENRPEVLLQPLEALKCGIRRGAIYRRAWVIALTAIALSVLATVFFGLGFFFASVWAWQVAGYVFTVGIYGPNKP